MPIETNLNVTPYFDDYDEDKNYHRILFRPGVALQAREVTQLQTILQKQIERFGDNIYLKGTIIDGCNLTPETNVPYIKLKDLQENGQPVALAAYDGALLIQESYSLNALVINYATGLESQTPDLNTLYIKYQNTGTAGQKVFAQNEVLKVFDINRTIESITITAGGSGYSNSDVVAIGGVTSGNGSGATATITTNGDGKIIDVSIINKGTGYTGVPDVDIPVTAGVGAILTAVNYIAQIRVADSATFGSSVVGTGSIISTSRGNIYQKGNFIKVDSQSTILQKYSSTVTDKVIGFYTQESIVNSNSDSTLLDIATGTPNYAAPGANRLKLNPVLTVINAAAAAANNDFLPLLEYQNGNVVRDRTATQFNSVNNELARRTYEESGNYVLDTFTMDTSTLNSNSTHFTLNLSPGTAYINGQRVSLLNNTKTPVRRGIDTANSHNQSISTTYGSYVLVTELLGQFNNTDGVEVKLRDAAATDVTDGVSVPTTPGNIIGTARLRAIRYHSGPVGTKYAVYKLYIFNVVMSTGKTFSSVRSIGINSTAIADVVLVNNKAELYDLTNDSLIFSTGTFAVKDINNEIIYYNAATDSTFLVDGTVQKTFTGTDNYLPYGITDSNGLTDDLTQEFVVVPKDSFRTDTSLGTVTANSATANVTGVGTSFTTTFIPGDHIVFGDTIQTVSSIANNTVLILSASSTVNVVSNNAYVGFPANLPIDMTRNSRKITIDAVNKVTFDLGSTVNTGVDFTVYHYLKDTAPSVRSKTVTSTIVKLSTDKLANTTNGPWCLGVPDAYLIEGVYVGSSNTYSITSANYVDEFDLISGQRDSVYGLSYLTKKPGSSLSLTSSSCLTVKLKAFNHGSGKYFSTESYPVDDTTSPLPSDKIRTETIPIYTSPTTGEVISLRDAVDFRPRVANTAVTNASVIGDATIDPSSTESLLSGNKYFPVPNRDMTGDIQSYLGRIDRITLSTSGKIRVIEGVPSNNPTAPSSVISDMDLGLIRIAPFPSLTAKQAAAAKRPDLKSLITLNQTRGYTMKDISSIESRIQRLEYYTSLNQLEANTKNLTITSEANSAIERFKNGFFVDPFNDYTISNINDGEYKAYIDSTTSRLKPQSELVTVDLKLSSNSNVTPYSDIAILSNTDEVLVQQPYANKERSLVTGYWNFAGKMTVIPRVDNMFDTQVTSTSNFEVNIADPLNALTNSINDALSRLNTNKDAIKTSVVDVTVVDPLSGGWRGTTTRTTTQTQTTHNVAITPATAKAATQDSINYLKSVNINPYIKPQKIVLRTVGLRPGAQHYVFFDGVDVTSYCALATTTVNNPTSINDFVYTYNKDASPNLIADSTGNLCVVVDLPGSTFTSGDKSFMVMDVELLNSEATATSKAIGAFTSFSTNGSSGTLNLSTKGVDLSSAGVFEVKTFDTTTTINQTTRTFNWDVTPTGGDPLAQSFYVHKQDTSDYVLLKQIEVFFKAKDASKGITLEIREMSDDGGITPFIVPFSSVYLTSSSVSTSTNASVGTTFTFSSPVLLKADREYAFVLTPDANSPDYRVWTASAGIPDVANTNITPNKTWGEGTLYYSTSNRAFTAIQDEDIKFNIRRCVLSNSNGTLTLTNDDTEYLTITSITGGFVGGETVAQVANNYLNTTANVSSTSQNIATSASMAAVLSTNDRLLVIHGTNSSNGTGTVMTSGSNNRIIVNATSTGTGFTTKYSAGDFIRIGNELRNIIAVNSDTQLYIDAPLNTAATNAIHASVTPDYDIFRVVTVLSNTIVVDRPSSYTVASGNGTYVTSLQKVVGGTTKLFDLANSKLHLSYSNAANSTFKIFAANNSYNGLIVGDKTSSTAKVSSIDNINVSTALPLVSTVIPTGTSLTPALTLLKTNGGTGTASLSLGSTTELGLDDTALIKSKSNEISGTSINKSVTATFSFYSPFTSTSPILDFKPASILFTKNIINNSLTNENTRYGAALSKYVSKRIVLADGLDAEDIKVYLTAYKPSGTSVDVYAKILGSTDGEDFNDKDWTLLSQTTAAGLYSSSINKQDAKEYEYTFPTSPLSTRITGAAYFNNTTTITGSGTTFTTSLAQGDIIKLVRTDANTDYEVNTVASITNNTTLVLSSATSFNLVNGWIEKLDYPKQAFKYKGNSNIVRYYTANKEIINSYKYLAVKVVLRSTNEYLVPELDDIRVLAVSV